MVISITLSSMHDSRSGTYTSLPSPPGQHFPVDPRYASTNGGNRYPPSCPQRHPGSNPPPLQLPSKHPSQVYPPQNRHCSHDEDQRQNQYGDYNPDAYCYCQREPPPNGYPLDYRGLPPAHPPVSVRGGSPTMAQLPPRRRTSIACRYCRKRKIRCSGYQSVPGGKCQNCVRMNQGCTFQPVSSSSTLAVVALSVLQSGGPPGTQLFSAYDRSLAPSSGSGLQNYQPRDGGPQFAPGSCYSSLRQSPTEPYACYSDLRGEDINLAGKRLRDVMDRDDDWRLLAPHSAHKNSTRRRSLAEFSSLSSPGAGSQFWSPSETSGSSSSSTPVRQPGVQAALAPISKMSLSYLVDKNDY
ncbi:Zn(2)-C6 fungal-type DNA-binding domain protein [Cordyceps fumosorosea ARSEF 2679]|uniref:Zn(2)-C6 fungal-type DNA-binding domain protein n=1 Tax=Cordyceps fumosorosea (strain ARSEF 2679) TaxID=1081104 RepID=A0A166YGV1_CORFA|nr:Zn(2)-C6 fungal-type DNA-binding domain protein [Cordyceps fumosorosea ARSEF 2679]OAA36891.1 Zn(2)-C6 fungal-type DNA-binding domain protein [Cordyceps fumosorosea ARSEF 2679]